MDTMEVEESGGGAGSAQPQSGIEPSSGEVASTGAGESIGSQAHSEKTSHIAAPSGTPSEDQKQKGPKPGKFLAQYKVSCLNCGVQLYIELPPNCVNFQCCQCYAVHKVLQPDPALAADENRKRKRKDRKGGGTGSEPRELTGYNKFMRDELRMVKEANPAIAHREAFKLATSKWAASPENPKVAATLQQHADTSQQREAPMPAPAPPGAANAAAPPSSAQASTDTPPPAHAAAASSSAATHTPAPAVHSASSGGVTNLATSAAATAAADGSGAAAFSSCLQGVAGALAGATAAASASTSALMPTPPVLATDESCSGSAPAALPSSMVSGDGLSSALQASASATVPSTSS